MTPDQALAAFCELNHAVFTPAHAAMFGFSEDQIARRSAAGRWEHAYLGTYRLAGSPRSWKGRLLAACWAGGFRAAASHRSAAALCDLAGGRRAIAEIICPRWRRARHDGVIVHESKAIDPADLTVIDGIPVTKPELTLLHLAAVCHESIVEMAFDAAERRELVTWRSVDTLVNRLGKQGRDGIGTLRALLERHDPSQKPTASEMETWMLQVVRRHGLPEPNRQYEIFHNGAFVARPDAAYPEWHIAIEYDSYQEHTGRIRIERDNDRRLKVLRAGWIPVTATAKDLRSGGREFCEAILASRTRAMRGSATPKP
jgi:hypothetical protein